MLQLNSWEAIRGMGVWVKPLVGSTPLWITAAEAHAKGSFETACDEYSKALEVIPSGDTDPLSAPVVEFIVNRVSQWVWLHSRYNNFINDACLVGV